MNLVINNVCVCVCVCVYYFNIYIYNHVSVYKIQALKREREREIILSKIETQPLGVGKKSCPIPSAPPSL